MYRTPERTACGVGVAAALLLASLLQTAVSTQDDVTPRITFPYSESKPPHFLIIPSPGPLLLLLLLHVLRILSEDMFCRCSLCRSVALRSGEGSGFRVHQGVRGSPSDTPQGPSRESNPEPFGIWESNPPVPPAHHSCNSTQIGQVRVHL